MLDDNLRSLFLSIPPDAHETEYYGLWNTLLNKCFPFDEGFMVTPGVPGMPAFEVKDMRDNETFDIFILEVKRLSDLASARERKNADVRIRKHFTGVVNPPPILHAALAFGTVLRFYKMDRENKTIMPPFVSAQNDKIGEDTCPRHEWNVDILEEAGFDAFMERVNEAKRVG